jgi:hypothetical protein
VSEKREERLRTGLGFLPNRSLGSSPHLVVIELACFLENVAHLGGHALDEVMEERDSVSVKFA